MVNVKAVIHEDLYKKVKKRKKTLSMQRLIEGLLCAYATGIVEVPEIQVVIPRNVERGFKNGTDL